ncbi:hypothetical protein [Streptomyces indicus]|uniref:Uncharacterized protein n=1 Tax=Streptomyces indicus TaxID=417292 RepID=A0A1G8TZY3_9ACTN|nr:hypothetical protein [Streptomyces indicus]SDJ47053.1 hypothetical protein SAMN05421806_101552 [Streptomyces indicus]
MIARTSDNRRRRIVHDLPRPVTAKALRLVVEATNGAASARIFALRVYREGVRARGEGARAHGEGLRRAHGEGVRG